MLLLCHGHFLQVSIGLGFSVLMLKETRAVECHTWHIWKGGKYLIDDMVNNVYNLARNNVNISWTAVQLLGWN